MKIVLSRQDYNEIKANEGEESLRKGFLTSGK